MKETKQLILFLAAFAAQIVQSSTDGDGLNFKDAPDFLDELIKAPEAFTGISEVPNEIKSATAGERAQLYSEIAKVVEGLTPERFDGFVDAAAQAAAAFDLAISHYKAQA